MGRRFPVSDSRPLFSRDRFGGALDGHGVPRPVAAAAVASCVLAASGVGAVAGTAAAAAALV